MASYRILLLSQSILCELTACFASFGKVLIHLYWKYNELSISLCFSLSPPSAMQLFKLLSSWPSDKTGGCPLELIFA